MILLSVNNSSLFETSPQNTVYMRFIGILFLEKFLLLLDSLDDGNNDFVETVNKYEKSRMMTFLRLSLQNFIVLFKL